MNSNKKNEQVIVKKVTASEKQLLDVNGALWDKIQGLEIETSATPLANQPSPYIKATFDEKKIGAVKKIDVKGVHNGRNIFFYLKWGSETPNYKIGDVGTFPDGVSILFPFKSAEHTPIKEMGSKDYPTNSWYWRPDFEERPKNQVAHGLSTSLYTPESSLLSVSQWKQGVWRIVIGRTLKAKEESIVLSPGQKTATGFAIWEGANGERGGVKAFSKEWRELILEA
jgi:DMSO reductase family type II enzyme heme b subunit